jgi:putative protein kinase ArgK-like GTPase of G3E family
MNKVMRDFRKEWEWDNPLSNKDTWKEDVLDALDEKDQHIRELEKIIDSTAKRFNAVVEEKDEEIAERKKDILQLVQDCIEYKNERDARFTLEKIKRAFENVPVDDVSWVVMREELLKSKDKCTEEFCELTDEHGDCGSQSGECVFSEDEKEQKVKNNE